MKRIITILFILILTSTTAYAHPWLESVEIVKKADCSGVIKEGVCCWDTDNDILYCGTAAAAQVVGGVGSTGDVVGPASSTDNAFSRFDSTTGKLLQNSGVTCDDNNGVTIGSNTAGGTLTVKATEGTELAPAMSGASGVNWTYDANWVIAAGVNTHSAGSTGTLVPTVSLAPTAGTNYKISFTISGYSAGSVTMTFGGVLGTIRAANGTYTSYVIASSTGNLTFTPTTDFVGGISAVSVKVITSGTLNVEGINTFASRAILESGSAYAPALVFGTDTNKLGLYRYGGTTIGMSDSGSVRHTFNNADHWITSDTSTLRMGTTADAVLKRDSASTFAMGSTTAGNNLNIKATLTSIHTFHENNWDEDDATWTMTTTGPLVHVTGNTTTVTATNTEAIVAGTTYKVTITGTGGGGTATYTLGGVTGTIIAASGAIAITDYITATTAASMIITPASACTVSISAITIENLTDATGDLTVDGNIFANSSIQLKILGNAAYPALYAETAAGKTGFYFDYINNQLWIVRGGTAIHRYDSTSYLLKSDTATVQLGVNGDIILARLAANSLAMRNSTNAQTFSLYETYTDASNYEYGSWDCGVTTGDVCTFKRNTAGTGADDLGFNFTTAGKGVISYTMADHSATPIAATRTTKTWNFTFTAGDDTDGTCDLSGGQADCFTLPDPTTSGHIICTIKGTENALCDYLIGNDGSTVEVSDPLTKCSATDTCTDGAQDTLCIYDAGANAVIHNDMGQAETIICTLTYD